MQQLRLSIAYLTKKILGGIALLCFAAALLPAAHVAYADPEYATGLENDVLTPAFVDAGGVRWYEINLAYAGELSVFVSSEEDFFALADTYPYNSADQQISAIPVDLLPYGNQTLRFGSLPQGKYYLKLAELAGKDTLYALLPTQTMATLPHFTRQPADVTYCTGTQSSASMDWKLSFTPYKTKLFASSVEIDETTKANARSYAFVANEAAYRVRVWYSANSSDYIDSEPFYVRESSAPLGDGWWDVWSKRYYLVSGKPLTGWKRINGCWYYLSEGAESGAMYRDRWKTWGGDWYYLDYMGEMATNEWVIYADEFYYVDASGKMVVNDWRKIDGYWYYFTASGAMKIGWLKWNGDWYYLDDNGHMFTGWLNDGGSWYYLYSNGKMARATWVDGYMIGADGRWVK